LAVETEAAGDKNVLGLFRPAVADWFSTSFPAPTRAQAEGWPRIAAGDHTLICAPTGSGKTLTAFLWSIDRLTAADQLPQAERTRVLYISPLRALAFDVEKNLRAPLTGIGLAAERRGDPVNEISVAMRTGDTSSRERQALVRRPPDLLITTPESLYLMLTSQARRTLVNVDTVIIDEIHALAGTKRGAHLMLSLERLCEITRRPPQRIGLSATQRPLEETARFLAGYDSGAPRPVAIVDAGVSKTLDVEVVVPVEDLGALSEQRTELVSGPATAALTPRRGSIWPSVYPKVLDLVMQHRSTIIFCNARRQAERLAAKLNELAEETGIATDASGVLVKAHHGSLAREQRVIIEDQLKRGQLRALVATSSLELGIDMGAVDLVIQVESPGAVSRGLQRVGRAGHSVGEPSKGKIFPKHRADVLESAVVARRMVEGGIESTRYLRSPLDVLAQQIVAHVAVSGDVKTDALLSMVKRCANFADMSREIFDNVLDLLAGRYPSEEFNELRPRIVWDRVNDTVRARDGAQRLAVTNGGTIPDRGLFGVFLPDGTRVGELDEEMVYESRPGETFLLGASTWRIEDITFQKVIVTPAPGEPAKMPFWHGDQLGRPAELGAVLGQFQRTINELPLDTALGELGTRYFLDPLAAGNVVEYLAEQASATGTVPSDATVVIERFRDELGDWRVCIHTPYGTPVHAPWAMAIERRLRERFDMPVETMWADDGIVLRLPEAVDNVPVEDLLVDPDDIDELVVGALPQTALFAARFRECAARALLLPKRRPDQRTPLWQQRQRAADLLAVAAKYPTFPILLEASRECLQDVFDVPALRDILGRIRSRRIAVVTVDTPKPSPFAQSLLFNWIAAYMYEGDAPLAERRAAALSLDRDLLNDLLGVEELRELLDRDAIVEVEMAAQCLGEGRRARSIDEVHDILRKVGDLTRFDIELRCADPALVAAVDTLVADRRAVVVVIDGEERVIAAQDAALYRDALGCALPLGLPREFTEPLVRPLESIIARYARTHAPFTTSQIAGRFGITEERALGALRALEADGRVVVGEFQPTGLEREWCDVEVLRQIRRRSLAALRREVEPVEQAAYGRFLPAWHGVGAVELGRSGRASGQRGGVEALVDVVQMLQGASLVASTLESEILSLRVRGYRSADLDALFTSGELVWVGAGALGSSDGRVRLFFADQLADLGRAYERAEAPTGEMHGAIRHALAQRGASFWNNIVAALPHATDTERLRALWDLVWAGEVTNDSLAPLRAMVGGAQQSGTRRRAAQRSVSRPRHMRVSRLGPPAGSGRWSLVADLSLDGRDTSDTHSAHLLAMQLLERHGVLTREAVLSEGVRGGFAGVYGVLKVLEERGQVRRGYFVDGLGAAQFAMPGAVDRLRDVRDRVDVDLHPERAVPPLVLAATDPAQPYGSVLPWPDTEGRPARTAQALVIIDQGKAVAWFDTRSHHVVTFDTDWSTIAAALATMVKDGRLRSVEVRKVNGSIIADLDESVRSAMTDALRGSGFTEGYRGWVLRL
jgi:ATP-dependent Lhr-like helicase